jgi:hypothetical protein
MHALLLGLILVLLMSTITLFLVAPGCGDLASPILLLTGMLSLILAVGLTENRTKHTGEKP